MLTLSRRPPHPRRAARHARRASADVLVVSAGSGTGDALALVCSLPESTGLTVLVHVATREDAALRHELVEQTLRRGGRLVELPATSAAIAMDADRLCALVADVAAREVYVFGPPAFSRSVTDAARAAGAPAARVHRTAVLC